MSDEWFRIIQETRQRLGLTQAEVARRAELSPETVRAYEAGRRRPRPESLEKIILALDLPNREANAVLEGAGFAPRKTLFPAGDHPGYFYTAYELQHVVEEQPWPEFVLDDTVQVVAANSVIQAVWGVDFEREREARAGTNMSLLSVASDHRFADRMTNWDECVGAIVSVLKGHPLRQDSLDEPTPFVHNVLDEFASGDREFLGRLIDVWAQTPARVARCRWTYPVVWNDAEFGEMRFLATVSTASEPDGLAFNDWIPVDSASWRVLEGLLSSRT